MAHERTQDILKRLIVDALHLDGIAPESIGDDMPLFGGGLALDSLDALEITLAMEQHFAIKIGDKELDEASFASVDILAAFVDRRLSAR